MADSTVEPDGLSLAVFAVAMLVVPLVANILRLLGRWVVRKIWWDDWISLFALGIGRHVDTVSPTAIKEILKYIWVSQFFANAAIAAARAAALLLYARLLGTENGAFKSMLIVMHTLNTLWWLWSIVSLLILCQPFASLWDTSVPGSCRSISAIDVGTAVPSIFLDLAVIITPLAIMSNRRLLLLVILLVALTAPAAALGRLLTSQLYQNQISADFTYREKTVLLWAAAEAPGMITAFCLPAWLALATLAAVPFSKPSGQRTSSQLYSQASMSLKSPKSPSPTKNLRTPKGSKRKLHPLYMNEEETMMGTMTTSLLNQEERPRAQETKSKRKSFLRLSLFLGSEASFGEQIRRDLNDPSPVGSPRPQTPRLQSPRSQSSALQPSIRRASPSTENAWPLRPMPPPAGSARFTQSPVPLLGPALPRSPPVRSAPPRQPRDLEAGLVRSPTLRLFPATT